MRHGFFFLPIALRATVLRTAVVLPAAALLAAVSVPLVAPSADAGLVVSLGPGGGRLVLPDHTAEALAAEGVPLESGGLGVELGLGWAFESRFDVGLRLAGSGSGSDSEDGVDPRRPTLGQMLVEATAHLRPGARVNPQLTGGFGGAIVGFGENPDEDRSLEAAFLSVGAGVEVQWTRHWGMAFGYRYSMLEFGRQLVILPGDPGTTGTAAAPTAPLEVAGDAALHHLGFSWVYRM